MVRHRRPISIHALREEGDRDVAEVSEVIREFLSTPSARRATSLPYQPWDKPIISIHALREEGDLPFGAVHCTQKSFLSTPSARRATSVGDGAGGRELYFYPRPPRGGRQQKQRQNLYFQTNYTTFCTDLEEL